MLLLAEEPAASLTIFNTFYVTVKVIHETLLLPFFPALLVGKRQAASLKGVAELLERIWPYAMELLDFSLAESS